jgi:phospholipid/cholesterol/gamma-HCH transport system substrate-binding protein
MRRATRIVVLLACSAMVLTGCDFSVYSIPLPGGADLGNHPFTVTADFRDVLDLVPQSAVKVDDVTVGRVDTISLHGYTARVTMSLRGNVKLPDNAVADIRQTSLLGEKYVSLSPPLTGAGHGRLGNGDVIPLARTGRNPTVEEVLGALSLILNGGGIANLKTIAVEVNKALSGHEDAARSVLSRLRTFMGRLDDHKGTIAQALDSLNHLSATLDKQKGSIALALDRLPPAIRSINSQRDDLVRMLQALARLSKVGTRVIQASKLATVDSLRSLAPTLTELARAGSNLPKSLQIFLTYPFVDAVVGTNPAEARNLHMGDYQDLSARLDLNITGQGGSLPKPPVDCSTTPLAPICKVIPKPGQLCKEIHGYGKVCGKLLKQVQKCMKDPSPTNPACAGLPKKLVKSLCAITKPLCPSGGGGGGGGGGGLPVPTPSLSLPAVGGLSGGSGGLPRAPFGSARPGPPDRVVGNVDTNLGALLVWGMMSR